MLDPNGRISNDRYEQVAKALGAGGMTGNAQRTIATLDQLDRRSRPARHALAGCACSGQDRAGQRRGSTRRGSAGSDAANANLQPGNGAA
jgi:hypothetical protein